MDEIRLRVLLVDDDKNIRQTLRVSLATLDCEVIVAATHQEAVTALKAEPFDFLLTDFRLDGKTGLDVIQAAKRLESPPIMVVMTAYASFDNAVNAIKEGAFDYLSKPFTTPQLEHVLAKVRALVVLKRENIKLRKGRDRSHYFTGMASTAMTRLEEFVSKIAGTDSTVLLVGESGTGKTELAHLIHERSHRARKPFVVVNCTSIAETLLESELFGHVKGSFTGANQDHIGKLEFANHGTLLIDEIGDLSLAGQTKLLRFLQERVIERVGSNQSTPVNVRVIAATNKNLEEAVKAGRFREDLYYRLNVFECTVVPLRHRAEDLPVLIQRFLKELSAIGRVTEPKTLSAAALRYILEYHWPGNIRELRNVIERMIVLSGTAEMGDDLLPEILKRPYSKESSGENGGFKTLEEIEKAHIGKVLSAESNQERAATILGITTVTLWRKRKEYGLP